MSERTYMMELVGSSVSTIEGAIQNAVAKAARDHKNLRWLEVQEICGPCGPPHGQCGRRSGSLRGWPGEDVSSSPARSLAP